MLALHTQPASCFQTSSALSSSVSPLMVSITPRGLTWCVCHHISHVTAAVELRFQCQLNASMIAAPTVEPSVSLALESPVDTFLWCFNPSVAGLQLLMAE